MIWIARHVITWILISLFLALALNPAVDWFQRHGIKRRARPPRSPTSLALAVIVAIGYAFIPTLVDQVNDFVAGVPSYVDDLTKGAAGSASSRRSTTSSRRSGSR